MQTHWAEELQDDPELAQTLYVTEILRAGGYVVRTAGVVRVDGQIDRGVGRRCMQGGAWDLIPVPALISLVLAPRYADVKVPALDDRPARWIMRDSCIGTVEGHADRGRKHERCFRSGWRLVAKGREYTEPGVPDADRMLALRTARLAVGIVKMTSFLKCVCV